jgi:hypothetical protein
MFLNLKVSVRNDNDLLFNNSLSISEYITLSGSRLMNEEFERMWKEAVVILLKSLL